MTLSDLFFVGSVLFVAILLVRIAISAFSCRWQIAGRLGRLLGGFVAAYLAILVCVALLLPRRLYAPGERRCFDDWCIAAIGLRTVEAASGCQQNGVGRSWIATVRISSDAKRIRQRAPDARVELEDSQGRRYRPCAASISSGNEPARMLSDALGPGDAFNVSMAFRLPDNTVPMGLVVHHGDVPAIAIVGADQSLLHRPALHRF